MPELRQDVFKNSWVVIATDVELKPVTFPLTAQDASMLLPTHLSICEGQESMTPPELGPLTVGMVQNPTRPVAGSDCSQQILAFNRKEPFIHRVRHVY